MAEAPLVVCVVDDAEIEQVSVAAFVAGATAVEERFRADGRIELQIGFATSEEAERALATLPGTARVEFVDPSAWVESQRPWIEPTKVGPFEMVAPWMVDEVESGAEHRIVIDPGAAFGHGGHPSTRLLLGLLPEIVGSGSFVIDVGTGTGVLAIAAARLGATAVAVDNDPMAVAAAHRNIERNDESRRVRVELGDIGALPRGGDVALVNLTLEGHRGAVRALGSVPIVAISGLVGGQFDVAVGLYAPRTLLRRVDDGEWSAGIMARSDSEGTGA